MGRLTIPLDDNEKNALFVLAKREYRDPRSQAALLIREALQNLGLLAAGNGLNDE